MASDSHRKLVLIGAGGHCKSVLDTVLKCGEFAEIAITDSSALKGTRIFGCEVAGNDEVLPELLARGFTEAFITVGSIKNSKPRERLAGMAQNLGFKFPVIIDTSAVVSKYTAVGEGTFIGKNAVVNAGTCIGKMCIINTGSIIEHENVIGDYSHVSVGAVLCGNVVVDKHVFIGANSTIIQGVKIGMNAIIGAGSVVLGDVDCGKMAVGIFHNRGGGG